MIDDLEDNHQNQKPYTEITYLCKHEDTTSDKLKQFEEDLIYAKTASCDLVGKGHSIQRFEIEVATILGKERGLFCISDAMLQLCVLRQCADDRGSITTFGTHPLSQLATDPLKAHEYTMGLECYKIGDSNRVMTLADIHRDLDCTAIHSAVKLSTLVIELPQRKIGGAYITWEDLVGIRNWADANGVKLYATCTRLWEAEQYYNHSIKELSAIFHAMTVSFQYDAELSGGAMLLGDKAFIKRVWQWVCRLGGNIPLCLPFCISAERKFKEHLSTISMLCKTLQDLVSTLTRELTAKHYGIRFVPPIPQCAMVHVYLKDDITTLEKARDLVRDADGFVLFTSLEMVPMYLKTHGQNEISEEEYYFEWTIDVSRAEIDTSLYLNAWKAFFTYRHDIYLQNRFVAAKE